MPTTFLTTPVTPNGLVAGGSGTVILGSSAHVFHDNGTAIGIQDGAGNTVILQVFSNVVSGADGGNGIEADGADEIFIGATGSVSGGMTDIGYGIHLSGDDNTLVNAGFVSADYAVVTNFGNSARTNVTNSGTITGQQFGVLLQGDDSELYNSGTITSQGVGVISFRGNDVITNAGLIKGGGGAVGGIGAGVWFDVFSGANTLNNSGTILAEDHLNSGISFAVLDAAYTIDSTVTDQFAHTTINNSGMIDGDIHLTGGQDVLNNTGTVIGEVNMGVGFDEVLNAGLIQGNVAMGSEDDSFRNTGTGFVDGSVFGDAGNDQMLGGDNRDVFFGGDDNDTLRGFGGDDILDGQDGNDVIGGGDGDDSMDGGLGNDTMNGGAGIDTLNGGNGNDLLRGGADDDELFGNSKDDTLRGGTGDDTLDGGNDDDLLMGQQGNDVLLGTAGFDTLLGGGGDDSLDGGGRVDVLNGGTGNDTMTGAGGNDVFVFDRHAGNDIINDFTNNSDVIDLSAFGLQNFNRLNLLGALNSEAGGTYIDLNVLGGSGTIWLDGFSIGDLDSSDFIF